MLPGMQLLAEINWSGYLPVLTEQRPRVVVVDSIQTVYSDAAHVGARFGRPGARMRGAAHALRQAGRHTASSWSGT
jgi:predicted ATP-dependent serine protease